MDLLTDPVHVRVPATSANLGPGFDSLGLALALHDEVSVEVLDDSPGPPQIEVEGEGAGSVPTDETHLVHRALCAGFQAMALDPPRVRLHCRNGVPHGRGLGSSSAAIVSGLWAARELASARERWGDEALLDLAARIEGHPDNVAPAVLGGFTIAYEHGGHHAAVSLPVQRGLGFCLLVPEQPVPTTLARSLLPPQVGHADAARNASRAALLVAVLTGTADPRLAVVATEDWLHQTYRGAAMSHTLDLVASLRRQGVAAVVSGAGPSVLAMGGPDELDLAASSRPQGWRALLPAVDDEGATRVEE